MRRAPAPAPAPAPAVRAAALERLLRDARERPRLAPEALAVFVESVDRCARAGAACDDAPWPVFAALRGVHALGAPADALATWRTLAEHPSPGVAETAILLAPEFPDGADYLPALRALLDERRERKVRYAAACALGQLGDAAGTPTLVALVEDLDLRGHALETLGQYGDAGAIPALRRALGDRRVAYYHPEPGAPVVFMRDIARDALQALCARLGIPVPPPLPSDPEPAAPAPPPVPTPPATAASAADVPAAPLPEEAAAPRATTPRVRPGAWLPLVGALLTLPWTFYWIVRVGAAVQRAQARGALGAHSPADDFDGSVLVWPAAAGLVAGVAWLLVAPRVARREGAVAGAGLVLCALIVATLLREAQR